MYFIVFVTEGLAWYIPMGKEARPWKKPLKERQAHAVRSEPWQPSNISSNQWKHISNKNVMNKSRDTHFDLNPSGELIENKENTMEESDDDDLDTKPLNKMSLQVITKPLNKMSLQVITKPLNKMSLQVITKPLNKMSLQVITKPLNKMSLQVITKPLNKMSLQVITKPLNIISLHVIILMYWYTLGTINLFTLKEVFNLYTIYFYFQNKQQCKILHNKLMKL